MYPVVHICGVQRFSSYLICLFLAFVACSGLGLYVNRQAENPLQIGPFVIVPVSLFALLGAKLMFVFVPEIAAPSARVLWPLKGGLRYYGGLVGGIAGYAIYLAAKRNNVIDGLDFAAPFAALGEAITRIGCFLGGCCWGIPVSWFPGVVFPRNSPAYCQQQNIGLIPADATASLPVHAVQLYMALCMIALFVVLRFVARRTIARGEIALLFLIAHCFIRFWIEFLRADTPKTLHGLSQTQWIALVVYGLALAALMLVYRTKRNTPVREATA